MDVSANMSQLLPDEMNGWNSEHPDNMYTPSNLYNYINGGAELYVSYGFTNAISRHYVKAEQPGIQVDIFDMQEAKNSYGVFSISKETVDTSFGQGSQYLAGSLIFWKDKYFISILADYETPEVKEAMQLIAGFIDQAIKTKGEIPAVAKNLPVEGLESNSIIYFNHHAWQNTYYFLVDENVFHITKDCNAVLAKYTFEKEYTYLLMIEYKSPDTASEGYSSFMNGFFGQQSENEVQQLDDEKWICCFRNNRYVVCIHNGKTKKAVEELYTLISKTI